MSEPFERSQAPILAITSVTVEGFKSLADRHTVEIRPLTLLAGANSSGKSSLMQPLLLLKQTLESNFETDPLLLDGPNVSFHSASEFLSFGGPSIGAAGFVAGFVARDGLEFGFVRDSPTGTLRQEYTLLKHEDHFLTIDKNTTPDHLMHFLIDYYKESERVHVGPLLAYSAMRTLFFIQGKRPLITSSIASLELMIHIPGLRSNLGRLYPRTGSGPYFVGTFDNYTGNVLHEWHRIEGDKIAAVNFDLTRLGLTSHVKADAPDDARVRIQVAPDSASPNREPLRWVNIADVGLGVSQTLPVVVGLHAAQPGQLVYIEQPEIHLHPRAQVAMARVLADAAKRGVRVVAETHSSLLLLAVQTLVAEGKLAPEDVALHWFSRDPKTGKSSIKTAELDQAGRFGDWPEDFADVALEAENRYLNAAEARLSGE